MNKAVKVRNRKDTCQRVPELAAALAEGATTGDRVDVLANATVGLKPDELAWVAVHGAVIAEMAASGTQRQYRETVERIVGQARDDDGLERLGRQRRAARLRWWTDTYGMWNLSGKFDPVRGIELEGRLRNTVEAMFHDKTPDDAPAAHAHTATVAALQRGAGGSAVLRHHSTESSADIFPCETWAYICGIRNLLNSSSIAAFE